MPLDTVDKIWMDGELVAWDDAKIHILTHTLHYGCGVFEGIRAYETDAGPGRVPPHRPHRRGCSTSAKIFMIDIPYTPRRAGRGHEGDGAGQRRSPSCYIRPHRLPRLRRDGPQPAAVPGERVDRGVAVGHLPRRRGHQERRAHEDLARGSATTPTPCRPRPRAPACTSTRRWPRSRRSRPATTRPILLSPQGYVSECTGENIFIVKDGAIITPPASRRRPRGHHPGLGDDASPATSAIEVPRSSNILRSDLYTADEAFLTRHRRRGRADPLGRRPRDRRARARSPARSRRRTSPPSAARSTATRTGSNMSTTERRSRRRRRSAARGGRDLRHDAARRQPARGHLAHRRRQAAHRRAARPPRRALHRGRLAGRQPEGRRVLPRGPPTELDLDTATLVAFGSTRRAKGKVDSDDDAAPTWSRPAPATVCIVGKCWDYHVTEALRTDARRGRGHGRRLGRVPRRARAAGLLRRRALLRRLQAQPRVQPAGARGRGQAGRRRLVLCDTNGGSLPHEVERIVGEVVDYFGDDVRSACTSTTTPAAAWPTRWPACAAAPRQVQGTINGYGERTGNCNLTTIIPNLTLKMGVRDDPRRAPRAAHPGGPPHRRAGQHHPRPAAALRRARRPSPTRPACTSAPSPGGPTPTSTSTPTRSATAPASSCPSWPAGRRCELKAQELGLELDGPALTDVVDRLKQLEHEGYHFEAADGSLELLMRDGTGWDQTFFTLESFRVAVEHRAPTDGSSGVTGPRSSPRPRSRSSSTASGSSPPPRATARSTRSTRRCARPSVAGAHPALERHPPHRLQGARPRHAARAPAPSPGC